MMSQKVANHRHLNYIEQPRKECNRLDHKVFLSPWSNGIAIAFRQIGDLQAKAARQRQTRQGKRRRQRNPHQHVGPMNQAIADLSGNTLFELRLRQAILAAQHDVKQVGLLLIDIDATDNFPIQDSDLAKEFSEKIWIRLRTVLRDSDTIVRMDGGELAVLLPSVAGPEDVIFVARKVLSKLEEPLLLEGLKFDVRPRIGIALFPEHSSNADQLSAPSRYRSQHSQKNKNGNTYFTLKSRTMTPVLYYA